MQSVHYDKRGAKITVAYEGDDCADKKDEVEQAANKLCSDNAAMASVCPHAVLCRLPRAPFQTVRESIQTVQIFLLLDRQFIVLTCVAETLFETKTHTITSHVLTRILKHPTILQFFSRI